LMRLSLEKTVIEALEASEIVEIVNVENKVQCIEATGRIGGRPVFFYIFPGRFTDSSVIRVSPTPLGCLEALYTPNGFYTLYWGYDPQLLRASLENKALAAIALYTSTRE